MTDPANDFVNRLATVGRYESSGNFTIDGRKALEKLSQYTLEHKNEWVLKAVQAAVVARGRALRFKLLRTQIELDFDLPQTPNLEGYLDSLLEMSPVADRFLSELAVGVRTLLFHHPFSLSTRDGERIEWDGSQLSWSPDKGHTVKKGSTVRLVVSHRALLGRSESFLSVFRLKASFDYASLLETRACYAPLFLSLDGREISWSNQSPRSRHKRSGQAPTSPLWLLKCHFDANEPFGLDSMRVRKGKEGLFRDRLHSREPFLSILPIHPAKRTAHFRLFYSFFEKENKGDIGSMYDDIRDVPLHVRKGLEENVVCELTRNGVVSSSRVLASTSLGGILHLECDDAPCDLTGLNIAGDCGLCSVKLEELKVAVLEVAREIRHDHKPRTTIHVPWTSAKTVAPETNAGIVIGAGLCLFKALTPVAIFALGVAGVASMFATSPLKKDSVHQLNAVLIAIRGFVEEPKV